MENNNNMTAQSPNEHAANEGSIEQAITGNYEFSIGATIKEAWHLTKGAKWPIHAAFLWYFLVLIAITIFAELAAMNITKIFPDPSVAMIYTVAQQIVINLIIFPITVGIFLLGVKRSVNTPLESTSVFDYFNKTGSLFLTMLIMYLMIIIGFMLLILPGIYLMVAYSMAMPLVVEKNMSPWQALETSRKTISKRWFSYLFLGILFSIIAGLSVLTLGLAFIWTVPLMMIAYGVLYRNMFGVEETTRLTYV